MDNSNERTLWDDIKEHILLFGGLRLGLALLCIGALFVMLLVLKNTPEKRTDVTGVEFYGNYTGTNNDAKVSEFINSFFPGEIETDYSDVTFTYRATDMGSYACEAYLEFTIADPEIFNALVSSIADSGQWCEFSYDNSFMEYSIADSLYLSIHDEKEKASIMITDAKIGKVLYSAAEQKMIFSAILVCNDSAVDAGYFNVFFERFGIAPIEYSKDMSS